MNERLKDTYRPPQMSEFELRAAASYLTLVGDIGDVDYPHIQPNDHRLPHTYTLRVDPGALQQLKDHQSSFGQYEKITTTAMTYSERHVLNMERTELDEMVSVLIECDIYPSKAEDMLVAKKNLLYCLSVNSNQESGVTETYMDKHGRKVQYLADTAARREVNEMRPLAANDIELLRHLFSQR